MAFVSSIEEDKKKDEQQQSTGGETVVTTSQGSSSIPTGPSSSTAAAADGEKKASSTGWTNLQSYISANKGNDMAMAKDVSGTVEGKVQEVQRAKGDFQNKVAADVQKGTVKDAGVIGALKSDPTKVDKAKFSSQWNAAYGGPKDTASYQEYGQIAQNVGDAKTRLDQTQSDEGRQTLLADQYKRDDYGQGMKTLDSFILGASPDAKQEISSLAQKYGSIDQDWENLNNDIRDTIFGAQKASQDVVKQTRDIYGQELSKAQKAVQDAKTKTSTQNTQREQAYKNLAAQIGSNDPNVRAQAYKTAGIDGATAEWLRSQGASLNGILSKADPLKLGNFLDANTAQRYTALMGLTDKAINDDLTSKSSANAAFNVNKGIIEQGAEARGIRSAIETAANQTNAQRAAEYNSVRQKLADGNFDQQVVNATGLSATDLQFARDNGVDVTQFVSAGKQVNTGDVASNEQRERWGQLIRSLGLQSDFQTMDMQDEGRAVNYNRDPLVAQITERRNELDRLAGYKSKLPGAAQQALNQMYQNQGGFKTPEELTQFKYSLAEAAIQNMGDPNNQEDVWGRLLGLMNLESIQKGTSRKTIDEFLTELYS